MEGTTHANFTALGRPDHENLSVSAAQVAVKHDRDYPLPQPSEPPVTRGYGEREAALLPRPTSASRLMGDGLSPRLNGFSCT